MDGAISVEQCKAARAVLGWRQADLAQRAKVSPVTIQLFEADRHIPKEGTLLLLRIAFERAGVVFTADAKAGLEGVAWQPPKPAAGL